MHTESPLEPPSTPINTSSLKAALLKERLAAVIGSLASVPIQFFLFAPAFKPPLLLCFPFFPDYHARLLVVSSCSQLHSLTLSLSCSLFLAYISCFCGDLIPLLSYRCSLCSLFPRFFPTLKHTIQSSKELKITTIRSPSHQRASRLVQSPPSLSASL